MIERRVSSLLQWSRHAAIALGIAWACGVARAGSSFDGIAVTPSLSRVCAGLEKMWLCGDAIERLQQKRGSPFFERRDRELILKLRRGGAKTLVDTPPETEGAFLHYRFIQYLPTLDTYLIDITTYEGGSSLLVSRADGSELNVDSAPIFSPDRRYFATTYVNLEEGEPAVRIYRVLRPTPKQVWSLEPDDWGPGALRWIGPRRLIVATDGLCGDVVVPPGTPAEIVVEEKAGAWSMRPRSPGGRRAFPPKC